MTNNEGLFLGNVAEIKDWYVKVLYPAMMACEAKIIREVSGQNCNCSEHAAYSEKKRKRKRKKRKGHSKSNTRSKCSRNVDGENRTNKKSEHLDECSSFVNEDFKQFQSVTALHKEKQKELKEKKSKESPIEYVLDVEDTLRRAKPTCDAPQSHPDLARDAELYKLYGPTNSIEIKSMEAKLQAHFDHLCGATQPSFWPVIALNLSNISS